MTDDTQTKIFALIVTAAIVIPLLTWVMRHFFRDVKLSEPEPTHLPPGPAMTLLHMNEPRCCCGDIATEPAPVLRRGRGTVLRDLFGMPPRYRRVVVPGPAVYCRSHAHSADAHLARWLASQRAAVATAYAEMAEAAAVYETEGLPRAVADSLSGAQRTRAEAARAKAKTNGAGAPNDAN